MRNVTVAAIQMSIPETPEKSVEKAEKLVRKAAAEGANVILLPELFENWYFCQERRYDSYKLALPLEENPAVRLRCSLLFPSYQPIFQSATTSSNMKIL